MEAKKKAEKLYYQFYQIVADGPDPENEAKELALILIDEILDELMECGEVWMKPRINYWKEVINEINIL